MSDFTTLIGEDTTPELDETTEVSEDTDSEDTEFAEDETPDEDESTPDEPVNELTEFLKETKFKSLSDVKKTIEHGTSKISKQQQEINELRQMLYDALKGMNNAPVKPVEQATETESSQVDDLFDKLIENPKGTIAEIMREVTKESHEAEASFLAAKDSITSGAVEAVSSEYAKLTPDEIAAFEEWRAKPMIKQTIDDISPEVLKNHKPEAVKEYLVDLLMQGIYVARGKCVNNTIKDIKVTEQRKAKKSVLRKDGAGTMRPSAKRPPIVESSNARSSFADLIRDAR